MTLKFVTVLGLAMMAAAVPVEHHGLVATGPAIIKSYAPAVVKTIAAPIYKQIEYEHEAPAEYEFSYGVHDEHTGDVKSQQESRKGDVVHGRYELVEPDGHKRIVEYTADKHNGFNAVVTREETHIKVPEPAPQVHKVIAAPVAHYAPIAKVAYAAPAITKVAYAAPAITKVAYAAPAITKVAYAAPVAKVAYHAAPVAHYSTGHEISHYGYAGPISNYIHH